ncbi:hypothetical protein HF086_014603 [Spodoptera exigua]|uniref:Uncharacterized protein n=1 Tax=Spodoptera exigua TaxID=7107 RepID=A0A922M6S9_SPOEX|nr:hypothetical protein HF086_014603 [Spodoptera exigua]
MRRRSRFSDVTCPGGEDESQRGEENVVEPLSKGSEEVTLPETETVNTNQGEQEGVPSEHSSPKLPSPSVPPISGGGVMSVNCGYFDNINYCMCAAASLRIYAL